MSFAKAELLIDLATSMAATREGLTLDYVQENYSVSLRTAQRIMRALELQFPDVSSFTDTNGRKRWRFEGGQIRPLLSFLAEELAAVALGAEALFNAGLGDEAARLRQLGTKLKALLPKERLARLEPDTEALLEAQGFVARPGPRSKIGIELTEAISDAIKSSRLLSVEYQSWSDKRPRRREIAPLGLLSGPRRYLVGFEPESSRPAAVKTYRVEAMANAQVTNKYFERPDFDLKSFAQRSFGVYQRDDDIDDICWRFAPEAAAQARTIQFHPLQEEKLLSDGCLEVRFRAGGQLEMAWYLYQWGDKVEVIKPEKLRRLVQDFRREDFPAMP